MAVLIRFLQCGKISKHGNTILKAGLLDCEYCISHNLNYYRLFSDSKDNKKRTFLNSLFPKTNISTDETEKNAVVPNAVSSKQYHKLYTLPYIRVCGAVNTLKRLHTFVYIGGIPVVGGLKILDAISTDAVNIFFVLGGMICLMLYTLGTVCYKIVGSIYLSNDTSTVKISYLDFWGKRVDEYCPLTDVVPLSEVSGNLNDVYVILQRYSTPQKLFFSVRLGKILDENMFYQVFGKA